MATKKLQLKYPIILVHGLGVKNEIGPFDYFHGIPKTLKESGNQVFCANLTAWNTIAHRSHQLKAQIEKAFPDAEKVNLVGHSMGGLDARYLASQDHFTDRIASVTSIGSPNRGSTLVDISLGLIPNVAFHTFEKLLGRFELSNDGFKQLTHKYCTEQFNPEVPDAPGVAYFSATSVIRSKNKRKIIPVFWLTHKILDRYEGDNDGFVSLHSAKWGDHICTYEGDHYAQIGQFFGFMRGLDYPKFYDEIFSHLKSQGL